MSQDYSGYTPAEELPGEEPFSHYLLLADGQIVRHAADDANPHAPLPTEVNGVPVVSAQPATVGGAA